MPKPLIVNMNVLLTVVGMDVIALVENLTSNPPLLTNLTNMPYWETQNGEEIAYKDLEDSHLLNILKWIERRAENGMTVQEGGGGWDTEDMSYNEYDIEGDEVLERFDYKGLKKEAKKRKIIN